ncbi:hypothetical protein EG68_05794 [Paragonimus skrjabini miyazakii]|uniref:Uncharacterized protein n=1 Tax=Paragonimus skrjabini miyazakii TaxID=59628 RepID=A0A8S9YP18_9TREM|nr:hypothetical protein EG68_05794 [Paragonimus skrjabini miyazakii]
MSAVWNTTQDDTSEAAEESAPVSTYRTGQR